jgi:RNA polymerase sigma-70 factor (ECF subfamily)
MNEDREVNALQAVPAEIAASPAMGADFEAMYRRHAAMVLRAAYRVTGNASDAEDVCQTVFLRLSRREHDREAVENAESYLRRAAVNAALDIVRARRDAHQIPMEDVEPRVIGNESNSPERSLAASEIRDRVRVALASLNPKAAEMFALRYLEGYDNPEIARMFGTSQEVIAVTLHRARSRLRQHLAGLVGKADRGESHESE